MEKTMNNVENVVRRTIEIEVNDHGLNQNGQFITPLQTKRLFEEISLLSGKRNVSMFFNSTAVNMAAEGGFIQYERMNNSIDLEGKNRISLDCFPTATLFISTVGWVDIILKNEQNTVTITFKPEPQ